MYSYSPIFFRARRGVEVLSGECIGHVEAGQAARLQGGRVEIEHHLRRLAAERPGMAAPCTVTRRGQHEVDPQVGEVLLGQSQARTARAE